MKPVVNAIELFDTQNQLKHSAEVMIQLLYDLQTKSSENFAQLSAQLTEQTDMNALDLVTLIAAMHEIYK